jgi:hypothetical protein
MTWWALAQIHLLVATKLDDLVECGAGFPKFGYPAASFLGALVIGPKLEASAIEPFCNILMQENSSMKRCR